MKTDPEYIDSIHEFEGQWGVESRCGLKVVENNDKRIFIVTELYAENPGTSITNFCAQLATRLRQKYNVPPGDFVLVEHCPDRGSRLEFYRETFDIVKMGWDGDRFIDPDWERIEKDDLDRMIGLKR